MPLDESTKNRGRLGSLDRCGADLLAISPRDNGTLERAGGPATGAFPTVLGALDLDRPRGIHLQPRGQPAFRQEAADAVVEGWRPFLLQTRTKTLDGTLRDLFTRRYPGTAINDNQVPALARAA